MAPEPHSGWASVTAQELRSLVPAPESVASRVAEILAEVRQEGDVALSAFTQRFDMGGQAAPPLAVVREELVRAARALDEPVRRGLELAFGNVLEVAGAGIMAEDIVLEYPDRRVTVRERPVRRAAVYVPGGRAPYPSTVIMGVAAARAAGVLEIAVASPPPVDPVILGACRLTGVNEVYRMGGAQAVAALAYGTETVGRVDAIVGPGNIYVQEAKRQLSSVVGIDGFAGPSDLMVIVEDDVEDLHPVVLDLLAQAEHGAGTLVVAVSTSIEVCQRLQSEVADAEGGAVLRVVHAATREDALALAEAFAPEHLQLVGAGAEALAPRIRSAGCLFVGAQTATAFGDYIAGSNHILPTNGSARFSSGLSAGQFRRRFAEIRITDPGELARAAAPVARAEGFELHARSMEVRIRDNRRT